MAKRDSDEATDGADSARPLLEALHDEAWRWALSCARGDRETAMEALQESYLAVLEGRARFDGRARFKTFLFGVVRLTAQAARRKALWRQWLWAPLDEAAEAAAPGGQEIAVDAMRAAAAFDRLSTRQREAAQLVLIHGFTVTEAAAAMGVSRGAASRHYAAAKASLRARLGGGDGSSATARATPAPPPGREARDDGA